MREDLLQRGAALLRRDAANPVGVKFDLGTWMERGDVEGVMTGHTAAKWTDATLPEEIPVSCGTKACAFGLFAISKEFAAEGLSYAASPFSDCNEGGGPVTMMLLPVLTTGGTSYTAFEAAQKLFEINGSDALYFFDPCYYEATPTGEQGEIMVAERIENFINGKVDARWHPDTRHEYEDED